MNIALNCLNSGLGNGGGSKTTILCSKALEEIGHRCDIIATVDNFTWFEHKPVINYIPHDLDVIVATACTTVPSTLQSNVPKKAWYIRGHETWMWPEDTLAKLYNAGLFNIVNSRGLQDKLKSFGAESVVVHQGADLDLWEDRRLRSFDKTRIGCLYQKKPTKRWKDFVKLAEILGKDEYEFVGFGDTMRNDSFLDGFLCNPTHDDLVDFYSSCHIWFAPSVLEGLSNVPMEAMLCGCLLLGNNDIENGMICDYLFDKETGFIYKSGDIEKAAYIIRNADWSLVKRGKNYIINNIGDRETNMRKFVEILSRMG